MTKTEQLKSVTQLFFKIGIPQPSTHINAETYTSSLNIVKLLNKNGFKIFYKDVHSNDSESLLGDSFGLGMVSSHFNNTFDSYTILKTFSLYPYYYVESQTTIPS